MKEGLNPAQGVLVEFLFSGYISIYFFFYLR